MRRLPLVWLALVALLGTALVVGCGGGGTTTVTVERTVASEPTASTTEEAASEEGEESAAELQEEMEADLAEEESEEEGSAEGAEEDTASGECAEKGIGVPPFKSGKCTEKGITSVVASMDEPLVLETLKAKITGSEERHSISDEFGEAVEANGVFITFSVDLTNLAHKPLSLEENQTKLYLDENEYSQDFEVQNGYEEQSFLWQGKIQPEETMHGTVTFDVPPKVLKTLSKDGNLDFVNLGTEVFEEEFFEQPEIGFIQLYK